MASSFVILLKKQPVHVIISQHFCLEYRCNAFIDPNIKNAGKHLPTQAYCCRFIEIKMDQLHLIVCYVYCGNNIFSRYNMIIFIVRK